MRLVYRRPAPEHESTTIFIVSQMREHYKINVEKWKCGYPLDDNIMCGGFPFFHVSACPDYLLNIRTYVPVAIKITPAPARTIQM